MLQIGQEEAGPRPQRPVTLPAPDLSLYPRQPEGRATSPLAAMDMWALNLKAGGPCLTARPQQATPSPLAAAGEIGSLAVGLTRWRRQPARWPRLVVSASGRRSKSSREDGDESNDKASSSGRSYCPSSDAVSIGAIGEGSRRFARGKWSNVCRSGAD